jgi:3D (Asp-Asp-Asp) domain-containing protein
MLYPAPPRRPQAYRVGYARARQRARRGGRTWHFCLAALALLTFVTVAANSRSASAAPVPTDVASPVVRPEAGNATSADAKPAEPASLPADTAFALSLPTLDEPAAAVSPPAPVAVAVAPRLTSPAAVVGRLGASGQGRQLRAQVTAYSASVEEGTAWGITRSGTRARPGVVAVDPAVIPLGSRVRIAGLPGIYHAEDTGGGIHGAHVDVFMESRADAFRFGRQTSVLVEVLD